MNFETKEGDWTVINKTLQDMIHKSKPFPVILLEGEMGSGKTTFVRQFIESIEPNVRVNSPTFNLFNEYQLKDQIFYHFDLYRLKDSNELAHLGFEEIWGKAGICFVEWWQIARNYFSENDILLKIEFVTEKIRKFTLTRGPRF
jgi:tRNA threonylcarbamoyladenosine biosynthesis protein TsaE